MDHVSRLGYIEVLHILENLQGLMQYILAIKENSSKNVP
jgi:hypothetical protein